MAQDSVNYSPYLIAGFFTIMGALITAGITLLNGWIQSKRDRRKWMMERREIAMMESLKLIEQFDDIKYGEFGELSLLGISREAVDATIGILKSLKPWLYVMMTYTPDSRGLAALYDELSDFMAEVREAQENHESYYPDEDFPKIREKIRSACADAAQELMDERKRFEVADLDSIVIGIGEKTSQLLGSTLRMIRSVLK